jgi:asparagine synthase (glutamine-hydrolysing)
MCGIAGLFRSGGSHSRDLLNCTNLMTAALFKRGPDADGVWADNDSGIALGHRRLSILDLSDAGAQPMRSECGRFTLTFNGEIYNHLAVRSELELANAAPIWRGHSDTETLLYAIRHWGVQRTLPLLNGMFSFAIWDARDRTLTLCRDRFGEKPLFYGWIGSDLVFASELKAFYAHPRWHGSINRNALAAFMRYSYVPAPWSIWDDVRKLPSGSFISFSTAVTIGAFPEPQAYWSMRQTVMSGRDNRLQDSGAAMQELERLLSRAVARQSISDVPLGAFLSGGIDSSTIVALMQNQSTRRIKTFSIGFAETAFNEADHARGVARHLATDHTEMVVSPEDARDVIPNLAKIYDEPFADSSQIPSHLVAMLARRSVTVALSGDGGDELFGGYNRHVWGARLHRRFDTLPVRAKDLLAAILRLIAPEPANTLGHFAGRFVPQRFRILRIGNQMEKIGRILGARTFDEMYRLLSAIDNEPELVILKGKESPSWFSEQMVGIAGPIDPLDRMTLADSLSYLTDDILQKVDRAAMSVSLETRVPFLDKDLVEFSTRVPPSMKIRDGRGKWLVRQVLYKHVPAALIDRPKTGFSIPLDEWLRGPLKSWAGDLLAPERLRRQGLFNAERVQLVLGQHMNGRRNHGYWLWNVLMVQAWHDEWCPN